MRLRNLRQSILRDKKDDDVVVETVEEDKPGKEEGSTEKSNQAQDQEETGCLK